MDAETFKRSFLPFHRKLFCIACQLLECEADAEDLVQEAYMKLWDKRDGLSAVNNPEAFSVTLVKNMCFDILRSGKHLLSKQTVDISAISDTPINDRMEEREEAQQIKSLIASLPEQQQKVIVLKDVKGCSYEEIEEITGLNAINIRVLLSRARKRIREQYNQLNSYESR